MRPAEHFDGGVPGVAFGDFLVEPEDLGDLAADAVHRVEGGHRFLENHADLAAADLADFRVAAPWQVAALNQTWPPRILPAGCGSRRTIDIAVTLLPQPDSPTMPTVFPSGTENDTWSTARSSRGRSRTK
jgi:hypothetical protein